MKLQEGKKKYLLLLVIFALSRLIVYLFNIRFDELSLYSYWQYLDIDTLRHHLLNGIWYDHTQPPFFNFLLGLILKVSGTSSGLIFLLFFKLVSFVNACLLLNILQKETGKPLIAWLITLIYMLSPATIIFENELFYTSTITLLLLLAVYGLTRLTREISWKYSILFTGSLTLICLTRSMYHLFWLCIILAGIIFLLRKKESLKRLVLASLLAIIFTGSWYAKNKIIFGKFTVSTWLGMNLARNVFHDVPVTDSSHIEAIEPFSAISMYKSFISDNYKKKYAGLNDNLLLAETKNGIYINEKNAGYLQVADLYAEACKQQIKKSPGSYLKNVVQSAFIYFAPATRYPSTEQLAKKMKYYDLIYSFNLSQLAEGKQQRRIALLASAIPKLLLYVLVFIFLFRFYFREIKLPPFFFFALLLFGYSFFVSSLFEHYENMRFRYEAEPIFLILAGISIALFFDRKKRGKINLP